MFHISRLWSPRPRRHSWPLVRPVRVASAPQTPLSDTTSTRNGPGRRLRRAFSLGSAMERPRTTSVTRPQTAPRTNVAPAQAPAARPRPAWGHPAARTLLCLRIMIKTEAAAEAVLAELHRYARSLGAIRPADVAMALLRLDRELPDDASLLRPRSKVGKAFAYVVRELQTSEDQTPAVTDEVFRMVVSRLTYCAPVAPRMVYVRPMQYALNPPVVVW